MTTSVEASFPPVAAGGSRRTRSSDLDRALADLADWAADLFGRSYGLSGLDPSTGLTALIEDCRAALGEPELAPDRRAECARALSQAARLADNVSERTLERRAGQLAECERGLARLSEITTTAGLIDGVCDELIRCLGFKRTMLARVEAGMWRPWKGNAAMLGEGWVNEWIDGAIPLDELTLETRLLRERRPALVLDTNVPGVARMVHAARVRSYVAAPILPGRQVVGFFHADHGPDGRVCDEVDRDVLWNFAEGFGHLYERTTLREQLQSRCEQVRTSVGALTQVMDELANAELSLMSDAPSTEVRTLVPERITARLERFTTRELEVFELMVAGARNHEIAERLAITVGTVKSHVKNILGKLGVLNRSQAIALYLGAKSAPPV